MSLEERLQHAARELRAVEVDVPPLGSGRRAGRARRFGLQVVAVPMLFVVGGLVVVGVLDERREAGGSFDDTPVVLDVPAVVDPATPAPPQPVVAASVAPSSLARPSADAELLVIDRIVTSASRADRVEPVAAEVSARPIGFNGPL